MSPKDWESAIDKQIREAMERGDFDNLPGKGKPLDLSGNPYAGDMEMAFRILKDAGYAPDWIEADKAIRNRLARARGMLTRQWARHRDRLAELSVRSDGWADAEKKRSLATWQAAVEEFEVQVIAINKEIADLNLKVPDGSLQRVKIDAAREVQRVQSEAA